jgi:hypothetical protein
MAQQHAAGKPCLAFRGQETNGKTARLAVPWAVELRKSPTRRTAAVFSPEQATRLASGSELKWCTGLGTIPEVR